MLPDLGVYVVTSADLVPGRGHREVALAALRGGARAIQLRAPDLGEDELLATARDLAAACRETKALLVVNDRVDVAVAAGAGGAHVGQDDEPATARERLGPGRALGISVADPAQARSAEAAGADYLGVTVWPSSTKPDAEPVEEEGLRRVAEATGLPVVGIGGIDATNAHRVLAAGAAGVAVISAVAGAADPEAATRELVEVVREFRRRAPDAKEAG